MVDECIIRHFCENIKNLSMYNQMYTGVIIGFVCVCVCSAEKKYRIKRSSPENLLLITVFRVVLSLADYVFFGPWIVCMKT